MKTQIYEETQEIPGFRKIELPGVLASAIEKLNPTIDQDIKTLLMILDPDVFQTISELIGNPTKQNEVFEDFHYCFLDLVVESNSDFYDRQCHSFFYETRRVFQACINYQENQKGGNNERTSQNIN